MPLGGVSLADMTVISGLVLTLAPAADAGALDRLLAMEPGLSAGPRLERRVALVSEDSDVDAAENRVRRLQALPEVLALDPVYIGFGESATAVTARGGDCGSS